MALQTSSADPDALNRYSTILTDLDRGLQSTAEQLVGVLQHYEQRCTESGIRVAVRQVADAVGRHASGCVPIDAWVGDVARRFRRADAVTTLGGGRLDQAWAGNAWDVGDSGQWRAEVRTLLSVPDWLRQLMARLGCGGGQVLGVASVYAAEAAEQAPITLMGSQRVDLTQLSRRDLRAQTDAWIERVSALSRERDWLLGLGASESTQSSELSAQIAALHDRESELQTQLGDRRNRFRLSAQRLRWGFDDGLVDMPYRTLADDLEDEIADVQQHIGDLEQQLQAQHQYQALSAEIQAALTEKLAFETALAQHWWNDVPVYSQQGLQNGDGSTAYGCTPTSVSMVLAYWHEENPENRMMTPQELLDANVAQKEFAHDGMSVTNVHDDVQALGYGIAEDYTNADFGSLHSVVEQGPVVTIVKLGLGTTGTPHAVVVTGISPDGTRVRINDPWTGTARTVSREQFERSWGSDFGSGVSTRNFTVIHP